MDSPTLSPERDGYRLWESLGEFVLNIAHGEQTGLLFVLDDLSGRTRLAYCCSGISHSPLITQGKIDQAFNLARELPLIPAPPLPDQAALVAILSGTAA